MRGQERADSLKMLFLCWFWVGVLFLLFFVFVGSAIRIRTLTGISSEGGLFSVCGDSVCVKTRLRPQERSDSRASICVCVGPSCVCVCGEVRFLGFYNGFLAFFDIFENS